MDITFVETQKATKKTQKKEEKIQETIYSLNSEKTMKTFFSYSKKKWFLRIRKIQKIKTHPPFLS